MNNTRFDWLARSMSSRRAFNRALAGAGASLPGLRIINDVRAASCPKGKKRCGKKCIPKHRCCTTDQCKPKNSGQICRRGRCVCPGGMKRCGKRCILKKAACPPKPNASCPAGDTNGALAQATSRFAVTFTEPNGGRLTAAAVRIRSFSSTLPGHFELRLNTVDPATGVPQETTLATARLPRSSVSNTTTEWVRFTFKSPKRLQPGRKYALALSVTDATEYWLEWRSSNPCPNSQFFSSHNGEPFGPLNLDPLDMPFQTFVRP